ncbi:putative disease resistance protein [Camellia lanceoleosa]|uniref:Disease resistance protein n=1 Tax=Camellia lanceoleosa TaxID=1840588 RepID=A0ACC0GND5_9ERIC|nr:putative disease resistance protein [Camellia lanceoleosa]
MGGLEKTTLARKVYHHQDVRCHFDAFAWVSISQQWQLKDVLQRILTKLIPEKSREIVNMIDDQLVKLLYEFQQLRKCLLVFDDIWSSDVWESLVHAFPTVNTTSSKIIITTQGKLRVDGLRNLETLQNLDSDKVNLRDLYKLTNLRSLENVCVENSKLEEDPMATLEKLPNLRILSLERAFVGKEMVCSAHGFPHLKKERIFTKLATSLPFVLTVNGIEGNAVWEVLVIACINSMHRTGVDTELNGIEGNAVWEVLVTAGMNSTHKTGIDTKFQKTIKMKKIIEGIVVMVALVSVEAEGFR